MERANHKLIRGIAPALVTPFTKDGADLNREAIPALVDSVLSKGVSGLFVCGATGEPWAMTLDERKRMLETTVSEVSGHVPIIAHVGYAQNTADSVELAKHAKKVGANAVGSVPPFTESPPDIEATISHYTTIAEATDLPFYVYWRTATATQITPEEFLERMQKVPGFAGIKFTDYNFFFFQKLIQISDGKLNCLTGPDEMFLAGLVMGSDGAIGTTYNFMAEHYVQMYENFLKGNIEKAMKGQSDANELISLLIQLGVISGTKAILNARGINVGQARSSVSFDPLVKKLSAEQVTELTNLANTLNLK